MHLGVLDPQPQHGVVGLAGTRLEFGQRLPGAGHQLRTPAPQEPAVEVDIDVLRRRLDLLREIVAERFGPDFLAPNEVDHEVPQRSFDEVAEPAA